MTIRSRILPACLACCLALAAGAGCASPGDEAPTAPTSPAPSAAPPAGVVPEAVERLQIADAMRAAYLTANLTQIQEGAYPASGEMAELLGASEPALAFAAMERRGDSPTRPGVIGVWTDGRGALVLSAITPSEQEMRLVVDDGALTSNS